MPTTKQLYQRGEAALKDRLEWEKKLARSQLQRFCQDRAIVNNFPWPRASNVRFPLADTLIGQKKPFFFKVFYSSEMGVNFKGIRPESIPFNAQCGAYYDFIIKEKSIFEEEIQYCADAGLQDGETILKVTWDHEKQVPVWTQIDNLFLITPSTGLRLQECPWLIHVVQYEKLDFIKKYSEWLDKSELDKFVKERHEGEDSQNDQSDREESEYKRIGINRTKKGGRIVVWECHYLDDERKARICTVSPDKPDFDFKDDHAYPYEYPKGSGIRWMFEHYKAELINKKLHSARGIPERVQEGEHSLSAMWRNKHNAMTLYNNPMLYAENGIPGTTQNVNFMPGSIAPFKMGRVDLGAPPLSWDEEMQNTRSIFERLVSTPDYGIGQGNTNNDSRTATEVTKISNQQSMALELDTGNWKRFLKASLRQGWALIVQHKPESLMYYFKEEMQVLPPEALTNDYIITVSGSAEMVNKEYMMQKAVAIYQLGQNNPYANMGELFKNVLEVGYPGQVDRFYVDPQQKQAESQSQAALDITVMMTTGFPVQPRPADDHMAMAVTAMQFLQAHSMKGGGLNPQQAALIGQYIAAHRQVLKQQNKQAYSALNQQLGMLEHQNLPQVNSQNQGTPVDANPAPGLASSQTAPLPAAA